MPTACPCYSLENSPERWILKRHLRRGFSGAKFGLKGGYEKHRLNRPLKKNVSCCLLNVYACMLMEPVVLNVWLD